MTAEQQSRSLTYILTPAETTLRLSGGGKDPGACDLGCWFPQLENRLGRDSRKFIDESHTHTPTHTLTQANAYQAIPFPKY